MDINTIYIVLRSIRKFQPEKITRTLLRRGVFIKPGLETREPHQAALRYRDALLEKGIQMQGKHILVFGYGGRFAIGVELLRLGAAHVTLTDLFAPPDERRNDDLLPEFSDYLEVVNGKVHPKEQYLTLLHGDIRQTAKVLAQHPLDAVVSSSVYEHLDDVDGITCALQSTLKPGGFFVAYIDLRDHYFKYPFEMLCYSDATWKKWLNPTSNLNRYRLRDYRKVFVANLPDYEVDVLERDLARFNQVRARIRPEFISGIDEDDAVMQIRVMAIK